MAKEPVAGFVKTRLCPPCTPDEASRIARAALEDTLDAAQASGFGVVVALDGDAGFLAGRDVRVVHQRGHTMNERLEHAWRDLRGGGVQIAMDTPQITAEQLRAAVHAVERDGAALGLAADGGWWVLGLRRPLHGLFEGVPMSTAATGDAQRARLAVLGVEPTLLPVLRDVDVWSDAVQVARGAPRTAFAREVRSVASRIRGDR